MPVQSVSRDMARCQSTNASGIWPGPLPAVWPSAASCFPSIRRFSGTRVMIRPSGERSSRMNRGTPVSEVRGARSSSAVSVRYEAAE